MGQQAIGNARGFQPSGDVCEVGQCELGGGTRPPGLLHVQQCAFLVFFLGRSGMRRCLDAPLVFRVCGMRLFVFVHLSSV